MTLVQVEQMNDFGVEQNFLKQRLAVALIQTLQIALVGKCEP